MIAGNQQFPTMKTFLQTDWGPSLRQGARYLAQAIALVWTLAMITREALELANDHLAAWWAQVLRVAPAPVMVAAPVAAPPAPTNPPRPVRKRQPAKATTGKPRPARRRKPKVAPACGAAVPVGMGA